MEPIELRQWLSSVHESTTDSDDSVIHYVQSRNLAKRYVAARKLAQALLDGDPTRVDEGDWQYAPDAGWGSWMEGVPLLHAAMLNRHLIVDLIPAQSEDEFIRLYKCRPAQFLTILRKLSEDGRKVYINIRDYDPTRLGKDDDGGFAAYRGSASVMGPIFYALSRGGYGSVYLNSVRRHRLLQGLGGEDLLSESRARVEKALRQRLTAFLSDTDRVRSDHAKCLVRGSIVPAPIQIIYRIAYNLAFRELLPDAMSDDSELVTIVDRADRGEEISDTELAETVFSATMLHHKFTAPLTGAYGGTYNLDERELSGSELVGGRLSVIGEDRAVNNHGFLEVLYAILNNDVQLKRSFWRDRLLDRRHRVLADVMEENQAFGVTQQTHVPSPVEVDAFFDNMEPVHQWLKRKSAIRDRFHKAIETQNLAGRDLDFDDILEVLNRDLNACKDLRRQFAKAGSVSILALAAGAAAPASAATGVVASFASPVSAMMLGAAALVAHVGAEIAKDKVCGALCTRDDEKQVWRLYAPGT